ncbi:MAG: hypothetical protein VX776_08585, partial [Planctomycetota bacterium]|nr:hypothetical protein [Planctomycetota bacterium]
MLNLKGLPRPTIALSSTLVLSILLLFACDSLLLAQQQQPQQTDQQTSVLIEIQLPIQNNNIGGITRALDTAIDNVNKAAIG